MRNMFHFLVVATVLATLFQNCSPAKFKQESDTPTSQATSSDPYDGKPFVTLGICPDGSTVSARIILKDASDAELVRNNCTDVTPIPLVGADFTYDASKPNSLVYNGVTFTAEVAPASVPPLSSWYIQLQGTLGSHVAAYYDVDMFDTTASEIQSLKTSGHRVICSISTGTSENWRPDASSFASADLGQTRSSGEAWVNPRSANVRSIMSARLATAAQKGCEGVDLDNMDAYSNNSGFSVSSSDQQNYDSYLVLAAHNLGLIVAQHNAPELAASMANTFDFAIAEECYQFGECASYAPYAAAGKAILALEYTAFSSTECTQASQAKMSLIFVNSALNGASYQACP